MCILFIFINPDPKPGEYKIILASNRDEVIGRPTKPAHEWTTHKGCYGGVDMQPGKEGGTWLTINKHGRISVLLNIGQKKEIKAIEQTSRRGFYAIEWVANMSQDMKTVFETVKKKHSDCTHTFRLAVFDTFGEPKGGTLTRGPDLECGYEEEFLSPGFHALGNNAPGVSWNKVVRGKKRFKEIVVDQLINLQQEKEILLKRLIELLATKEKHWPDPGISGQMMGTDESVLASLSAIYVDVMKYYGTRTHTVILVDFEDRAFFYERTMVGKPDGTASDEWIENRYEFDLEPRKY